MVVMAFASSPAVDQQHDESPSREDQGEQIEEKRRRATSSQDVRMKKHPELWPHMPSDRYGTSRTEDTETGRQLKARSSFPSGHQTPRPPHRTTTTTIHKTRHHLTPKLTSKNSIAPLTKNDPQPQAGPVLPSSQATQDKRLNQKARSENAIERDRSIKSSGKRPKLPESQATAAVISESVFIQVSNDATTAQQQVDDDPSRSPEDSGVEVDSSLADSSDGLKENDCQQKESQRSSKTKEKENEMRLERARQELEEFARREAEDRRQRQSIVDNILSKFNPNP